MIQRIQTIYLLISLIAWSFLFFSPVIGFTNEAGGAWSLFANGIKEAGSGKIVLETVPLLAFFALVEIFTLVSIFAFRKQDRQLRITLLTMILQLLSYGIIALYAIQGNKLLHANPGLLLFSALPLVAGICSWLAYRGIRKDIGLLKSLDRLR